MKILSIETSCDETAMALVEAKGRLNPSTGSGPKFRILENLVASQIKIHEPYGGIVPYLAKREHQKNLPILFRKIFETSILGGSTSRNYRNIRRSNLLNIDLIAVTIGPGLEPCLWTGINFAKELHQKLKTSARGGSALSGKNSKLKTIGVNHLEGHLYSFLLSQKAGISNSQFLISKFFPSIALIVSGGHTILLLMKDLFHFRKLGETRDDAAGEAFDKVARLLDLPYPGGPQLEKLAASGNPNSIPFPRPMINQRNYDFSFSGLKTAVLYYLRENKKISAANTAASFQQAVIDVLTIKAFHAADSFKAQSIILSGGVANNKSLRQNFRKEARKKKINFFAPLLRFTTDNAAMTAVAAYFNYLNNKKLRLIAQPNLNL